MMPLTLAALHLLEFCDFFIQEHYLYAVRRISVNNKPYCIHLTEPQTFIDITY